MVRQVHAEGIRERHNMREAARAERDRHTHIQHRDGADTFGHCSVCEAVFDTLDEAREHYYEHEGGRSC